MEDVGGKHYTAANLQNRPLQHHLSTFDNHNFRHPRRYSDRIKVKMRNMERYQYRLFNSSTTFQFGPLERLWVLVFVDMLAVGLVIPLLPYYASNLGADAVTYGYLGSIYGISQLIGSPLSTCPPRPSPPRAARSSSVTAIATTVARSAEGSSTDSPCVVLRFSGQPKRQVWPSQHAHRIVLGLGGELRDDGHGGIARDALPQPHPRGRSQADDVHQLRLCLRRDRLHLASQVSWVRHCHTHTLSLSLETQQELNANRLSPSFSAASWVWRWAWDSSSGRPWEV